MTPTRRMFAATVATVIGLVATGVAYSMLKDALAALEIHYRGGARPNLAKMRSHMHADARPVNKPELREV